MKAMARLRSLVQTPELRPNWVPFEIRHHLGVVIGDAHDGDDGSEGFLHHQLELECGTRSTTIGGRSAP